MLATQPVPTMRTRGLKKRTRSWIVSPASTWPPWELMKTVMSSLDSPARASSCAVTPAATRWVISPLMITVRARNNRSAMRLYGGATDGSSGVNSSIGSPGFVGIVKSRRLPRRPSALPQLGQGPRDVDPGHLLPPREIEVGVVHRLRGAVRSVRGRRYALVRQVGSHERRAGFRDLLRPARDAPEDDARLHHPSPLPLDPRRDAEHREVERSAAAELVIEPRRRHDALAARGGADEHVVRAECHHHRRHVGRADGPAARGRGRHPADVPVLLHAEVDRLAPLVRLIVVIAARVEAEISPEGSHVAEQRGADEPRSGPHRILPIPYGWVGLKLREREARTERYRSPLPAPQVPQFGHVHERDDRARLLMPAFHVGIEICAAGDVHPIRPSVRFHGERV